MLIGENIARAIHWGCAIEPVGDAVADDGWRRSVANRLRRSRRRIALAPRAQTRRTPQNSANPFTRSRRFARSAVTER